MSFQANDVGWCHQCETFQLFRDARWLRSSYAGVVAGQPTGPLVPCCVKCGADEPWGLGVWLSNDACSGARQHAEDQVAMYPGDCDCPEQAARRAFMAAVVERSGGFPIPIKLYNLVGYVELVANGADVIEQRMSAKSRRLRERRLDEYGLRDAAEAYWSSVGGRVT